MFALLPSPSSGRSDSGLPSGSASWADPKRQIRWTDFTRLHPKRTLTPVAISQTFSSTYEFASSSERLGSDSHACRY
ncbi:unnamed protein product [Protopolystoma xenopodis]|uniref:Uncharacterized protein n=1 Tax=Protopolystoma xenopodis TaxID=117903 RepID=A0A3S5CQ64_9PLAT|nr:unnamed protein product [Protopolystoma xenopodis]